MRYYVIWYMDTGAIMIDGYQDKNIALKSAQDISDSDFPVRLIECENFNEIELE